MRVVGLGECVEKKLHLLVLILLVDVTAETIVAARDQLWSGLDGMLAQVFL